MKINLVISVYLLTFLTTFLLAKNGFAAEDVPVSATVPSSTVNAPVLVRPTSNAVLNTTRPTFVWNRPTPAPTSSIRHYDLYIDDTVFASSISDSLSSSDFYFYTATASSGTFYVTLKTDLAEGYHTWKVAVYTESGANATSSSYTFYIDSISPFITLTKVDKQTLNWDTRVSGSIPDTQFRYFTITTPNPTIKGGVESSANIQILLTCPVQLKNCQNQVYSGNITTGLWDTQFSGLTPGYTYTVTISSTDAANNSTVFPDFYLTFGQAVVTKTITATPTITTTPPITVTTTIGPTSAATPAAILSGIPVVTPPPGETNIIKPGTYVPRTPHAPTPPPIKTPSTKYQPLDIIYYFVFILMIIGLPLHLIMATFGLAIKPQFIFKFLITLAFPFLGKKTYQTKPFTCINLFSSDNLSKPWHTTVSDITGHYGTKSKPPEVLYVQLSVWGHKWKNTLLKSNRLNTLCLSPFVNSSLNAPERLQKQVYTYRSIPLVIAIFTSLTALILKPSYYVVVYFYLSLQYLYSQYLYKPQNT